MNSFPRRSATLSLSEFLTALSERWQGLAREEILDVLVTHAEHLPVRERQAFLEIFPAPHVERAKDVPPTGASLLADIDAFAARVAAGEYVDDEDYYRDRYGWSDEEAATWVPEADGLFAAIGDMFVAGDLVTAREAYERLLTLFDPFGGEECQLELWQLDDTDVSEALARYLRSVYETTPADECAETVHGTYLDLPWSSSSPTLTEMAGTRRVPLPGLDAFLPGWIECLLAETERPLLPQRVQLLAEAAVLHRGLDGLADLAARPGPHQGRIGLARIDALAAEGRLGDAVDAARVTLELPDAEPSILAMVADRLADLNGRLGDTAGAVLARRRAWTVEPNRRRLLALAADGLDAGVLSETLADEADSLATAGNAVSDRLSCELFLLTRRLDPAIEALTTAEPLGWSQARHPGPVVLPFLWVAVLGTAPDTRHGHLGQAYTAIDRDPDALPRSEDWITANGAPTAHATPPERTGPSLTGLFADVIRQLPGDDADRARWIATAETVVDARIHAIVSGKHRHSYARAASLAFAHAEVLSTIGRTGDAHAYVADVRTRFPRHVAFRRELDAAARTSTLTIRTAPGTRR